MSLSISISGQELHIQLGTSFRNKDWADEFGITQAALNSKKLGEKGFNTAFVDLSKCSWVDPLPLLSLLITLTEFKKKGGSSILILPIVLPIESRNTDKVLKFLCEEGFLEAFSNCCKIIDAESLIIDRDILNNEKDISISNKQLEIYNSKLKGYKKITTTIYYTNSSLLNALIINTKELFKNDLTKVDSWIEEQVNKLKSKISDKVPTYSQSTIIHRITNILVEMLQNIVKHAYVNSSKTYAGVYIRYRYGKENNALSVEEARNIDKALSEEDKHCPKLSREFLDLRKGCVEIFVIDEGIGFTESLRNNLPNPNTPYPFRESFKHVFIDGQRKKYDVTPNSTQKGGLFLIGEMLKANQDYLCGKDENEWVGSHFPLDNYLGAFENTNSRNKKVDGLCWIVRLSWKEEADINKHDWSSWRHTPKTHPAYRELENETLIVNPKEITHNIGFSPNDYRILDYRFNFQQVKDIIQKKKSKKEEDFFFFLPSINQTKYKLWKILIDITQELPIIENRTLLICDIPENEKRTYTYILHEIYFNPKDKDSLWINKFDKIVLISKRLSVCILKRENTTYKIVNTDEQLKYFGDTQMKVFAPHLSIRHYIAWIRAYDSLLYWTNIQLQNNQKQFFVNNIVLWNNELDKIDGYLNFAQTVTDNICLNIYKLGIERVLGFFESETDSTIKYAFIKQLDALTARLVDEYNSLLFNEVDSKNKNILYIGSVFVSGISLNDALYYSEEEKKSEFVLPIYFFKHSDSITNVPHILNWPKQQWLKSNKNFTRTNLKLQRVGRTHVIAEHGYKFYRMPRYDAITKESVYTRDPKQTYKDWQDPLQKIISFGHFDFDGKHDLVKINIIKQVNESFEYKGDLAKFLVSEFFCALGGYSKTELTKEGMKYWESISERISQSPLDDEVLLIAYPNNANSSLVVDRIKECFKPKLSSRIFSLMPINKERIGSCLLISPLVFNPIKEIISSQADETKKKVLLFDSAVISGRTRKEIKHLLFSLGAKEIKTLSVVDRFRLPFTPPDKKKHLSYWRLDIPRLGPPESCPLCQSLNEISKFKDDLASEFAKERIDNWVSHWQAVSHFNPISNGINPTPISPLVKNFGIEYDENEKDYKQIISKKARSIGYDNRIEITSSLGLTIYASELHSMTSKDDIAMSLCKKITDIPDKAVIELISSQLILFPNEYSSQNQFEMALKLFNTCNNIDYVDNHTALASIVLINQNKKLHQKLIKELFQSGKKEIIVNNIDVEIVLAYVLKKSINKNQLFSEKALRLLKYKDETSILHRYKQFHSEIYSEHGKIHTKPLITFYLKRKEISDDKRLLELNLSISKILYLLSRITEFRKSSFTKSFKMVDKTTCEDILMEGFNFSKSMIEKFIKEGTAVKKYRWILNENKTSRKNDRN